MKRKDVTLTLKQGNRAVVFKADDYDVTSTIPDQLRAIMQNGGRIGPQRHVTVRLFWATQKTMVKTKRRRTR